MMPDTFMKSGLNKLSPSELANLNNWLSAALPVIASHLGAATAPASVFLLFVVLGARPGAHCI
jgi:hypothetical protein